MKFFLCGVFVFLACVLQGTEYFVASHGNDSSDGTSEKTAFRTIQKGVSALDAGDTLTILPGCYHEAVRRSFDGDAAKKTVIRAKYPGSVLLHGDLPLTEFQVFDAERGLYAVSCPEEPEAVIEYDSLKLYEKARPDFLTAQVPNAANWFYDASQKKIYLRTSDGQVPSAHRIAGVTIGADGLILTPGLKGNVVNVEIDGLTARGFIKHDLAAYSSVWGITIVKPVDCVIRRCCAILSSGGINMSDAQKSRIEDCVALGNGTSKMVSGGNIIITTSMDSVIDRCFSYASRMYGIRFYGQNTRNTIHRSVSIEDERGSVWIKPCDKGSLLSEVFTPGHVACIHTENSVFRGNEYDANGNNGKSSLYLKKDIIQNCPDDFADTGKFDLRLTDDSRFHQGFAGKDFFYLAPDGNDQNSGHSRKSPRKSLAGIADGATVYLLPGIYTEPVQITQNNLIIAGHGQTAPAVIRGTVHITGNQVKLQNLSFISPETSIISDGESLQIENCGFAGNKVAVQTKNTVIFRHCAFDASVQKITDHPGDVFLMSCVMSNVPENAVLFGNAYAGPVPAQDTNGITLAAQFTAAAQGDFSLKNESVFYGTAADGTMIGPCSFLYEPEQHHYSNMKILSAGTQTASIQYEKSASANSAAWAMFREDGKEWKTVPDFSVSTPLSYISLNGLKPGTKYECYIGSKRGNRYTIGNHWLPKDLDYKKASQSKSAVLSFTTPATDRASQFWHVSPKGDDRNPGTIQQPFRTITKASLMTAPGDIVLVHGGTYQESILIPVSGTAEHPISYCAAPGEAVWIDGVNRQFSRTFAAFGKQYINFDGFRVKSFGTALSNSSGVFLLFGSDHIHMTRSMHDGRGYGYSPAILHARNCSDLLMKNCVNISSMGGLCVYGSNRVTLENNVLKMSLIWHLVAGGGQNDTIRFARNIVTDSSRAKTEQPLLMPDRANLIVEQDNLYFCRLPRELRAVVGFAGKKYTLDEYYKFIGKDGRSVFENPAFQAMPKQLTWKNWEERAADMKKGVDFQREVNNYENARNPENYSQFRVWDFSDFFTNPVRKTPEGEVIGLDPEQFKEFPKSADSESLWQTF